MKQGWKSRIIGHEDVDPLQLLANPRNWRIHPQNQQEALEGVLDEVGWVDTILVNKNTGFVVDGHLRVALAISREESAVPVTYLDITEEEEKLILATLDPIAAMAGTDREQLETLIHDIDASEERIMGLLDEIAEKENLDLPLPESHYPQGGGEGGKIIICPECGHEFEPDEQEMS